MYRTIIPLYNSWIDYIQDIPDEFEINEEEKFTLDITQANASIKKKIQAFRNKCCDT